MMQQGIFILMIMVYGARHEVFLYPYNNESYPNRAVCEAWKGRESLESKKPLTCVEKKDYQI